MALHGMPMATMLGSDSDAAGDAGAGSERDDGSKGHGDHGDNKHDNSKHDNNGGAAGLPAGPFDLFRAEHAPAPVAVSAPPPAFAPAPSPSFAPLPASASASAEAARRETLRHRLSDMVSRLMVGDGMHGTRSVRMELDDSWLPGVELSVYEEEGFWVAHFCCRQPESFVQLAEPGGELAVQLAAALARPCLWRVEGEGLPEHGDWRRHVNADGALPLAEYRVRP
jgi:hypothetical protein